MFRTAVVCVSVWLLWVVENRACLHPPASYKGSVEETSQQALIFWRDGREELILKIDYVLKTKANLPDRLAWVVPVPTRPDGYAVVDSPKIFEEAFDLAQRHLMPVKGGHDHGKTKGGIVNVVDKVNVGEYDITAIQAKGDQAAQALNKWLADKGFGTVPAQNMEYYTKLGWTFLAIQINSDRRAATLRASGSFRPLRISFAADRIYYPLKFSSHQGQFDVNLYVFTEHPLPYQPGLGSRGFYVKTYGEPPPNLSAQIRLGDLKKNQRELYQLVGKMAGEKLGRFSTIYFTHLFGAGINGKGREVSTWKTDFQLAMSSGVDSAALAYTLHGALRSVINEGAKLYNTKSDAGGCYQLYYGALLTVRPLLKDRPDLQKAIDDGLAKAKSQSTVRQRAFTLNSVLQSVRAGLYARPADPKFEKKIIGGPK